jgi:hypothetical protein
LKLGRSIFQPALMTGYAPGPVAAPEVMLAETSGGASLDVLAAKIDAPEQAPLAEATAAPHAQNAASANGGPGFATFVKPGELKVEAAAPPTSTPDAPFASAEPAMAAAASRAGRARADAAGRGRP